MGAPRMAEIHQVGSQMIHLVCEPIENSNEFLGLIEGGGICLANSFPNPEDAEAWMHRMFNRLYATHICGLGCIRVPGSEFLADDCDLERLAKLEDRQLP